MDEKQIWLVLGIEATKEEDEIKQAYRSRLVSTNPEEDPEGFKRLRKAYEMALELAAETGFPGNRASGGAGWGLADGDQGCL